MNLQLYCCVSPDSRRNEQIIGGKTTVSKQPGAYTVVGDDPKKFAAAMVEYSKDKVSLETDVQLSIFFRGVMDRKS